MRIVFFSSDKPREHLLADAFADGARLSGDSVEVRSLTGEAQVAEGADVAVMVGVKSRALYKANWAAGISCLYFDKGYTRHSAPGPIKLWEYWRVAVNSHHPTDYFQKIPRPGDRLEKLGIGFAPWRKKGNYIVFAGSSQKYHDFYGLTDPTRYAGKVIKQIEFAAPGMQIIYRPKPSWKDAEPINGTVYSRPPETITDVLADAHCLVTHGSNACFEALQMGVPCVILGEAVAKHVSSTSIDEVKAPRLVHDKRRRQWFADLAYCQWSLPELASGEAWKIIKPQIYG